ncbi:MAG: PAS domain-containing protein [Erythrobacter sp.]
MALPTSLERDARSDLLSFSEPESKPIGNAASPNSLSEDKRLTVLASFDAEALAGDEELARLTRFAAQLCGGGSPTVSASVSLVEAERQRFIVGSGMTKKQTPRSTSLCSHAMLGRDLFEVLDASKDDTFANFELVRGDAHLRYYVGAPLISGEGASLGALCVTDTVPRTTPLNDLQREGLSVLAESVMRRLNAHREANTAGTELKESAQRLQFMLDSVPDIAWSAAPGPQFNYFNARFTEVTGLPARESVDDWREVIHPEDFEASLVKFQNAMSTASFFEDEWRLRQSDGTYRWVISRAVPSTDDPETARWFGTLTDIHDRYRISQERELLAGELAHRIKNVFSVITGLVSLHARGDATLEPFARTLADNIQALSRAQSFALQVDAETDGELKDLLGVLMAPYGVPGESAVNITGDSVQTGARAATPLALVFHELATNSAKYGALSVAEGNIAISVSHSDGTVQIGWTETGGPPAQEPQDTGFGSRLVKMSIEHQLGGTITRDWQTGGLNVIITVPSARLEL